MKVATCGNCYRRFPGDFPDFCPFCGGETDNAVVEINPDALSSPALVVLMGVSEGSGLGSERLMRRSA